MNSAKWSVFTTCVFSLFLTNPVFASGKWFFTSDKHIAVCKVGLKMWSVDVGFGVSGVSCFKTKDNIPDPEHQNAVADHTQIEFDAIKKAVENNGRVLVVVDEGDTLVPAQKGVGLNYRLYFSPQQRVMYTLSPYTQDPLYIKVELNKIK